MELFAAPIVFLSQQEQLGIKTSTVDLSQYTFGAKPTNAVYQSIFYSEANIAWMGASADLCATKAEIQALVNNELSNSFYDELYQNVWWKREKLSLLPMLSDADNAAFTASKRKMSLVCHSKKEYVALESFEDSYVDPLAVLCYVGLPVSEHETIGRWAFQKSPW